MQADGLFDHITRDHHPNLIQELLGYQASMKALPEQLFLQVFCIWELIPRLVETATMYYAQRRPSELGSFVWRVDAKDRSVTSMERLWTILIGPVIMAKSDVSPMGMIPAADYSYYERFDVAPPDGTVRVHGHYYTDMRKVLREDFEFASSESDLGLQMADIVASILTRALNGTLHPAGWRSFGSLFVRRREHTARVIALSWDGTEESKDVANPRWAPVIHQIEALARPMLTRATMQLADEGGDG
jgi:hypothetical protein